MLYILPTPIGNLKDITLRTIEILESIDAVICEDSRRTGLLLSHYKIKKDLIIFNDYNEFRIVPQIIQRLKLNQNLALVSDAGSPLISDPEYKLIRECISQDISLASLPGPSSVITALTISGLPPDKFMFIGYLPRKSGHRDIFLKSLNKLITIDEKIHPTIILFEAPHKIKTTLQEIKNIFGDINIVICRELTKVYEETRREKISQSINHYIKNTPKGEFIILFNIYTQNINIII